MKKTSRRRVPATTETYDKYACDLCGAETDGFSLDDVSIYAESRPPYADSGGERVGVDCCRACFDTKVLPALEALGFKPRTEEW